MGYFFNFEYCMGIMAHDRDFGKCYACPLSDNICNFICVNTFLCINTWLCVSTCASTCNRCLTVGSTTQMAPHLYVWIDARLKDVSATLWVSVQVGVDEYTLCQ